jgi:formylglycine-generating enzyme required for sulfatase activity
LYASFWSEPREVAARDVVAIEPEGVQALVLDEPASVRQAMDHFRTLSRRADVALPAYDERCPRPRRVEGGSAPARSAPNASMIEMPAGSFDMGIRHDRRECGCYPFGATDGAMWGWFYKDLVTHEMRVEIPRFRIRSTAVTNAEFLDFVLASGYRPRERERFLHHIPRTPDGSLPSGLAFGQRSLPVTFVSLSDARAYAAWCGQRLPTEAEWQWAAEGAGACNRYPWGADERAVPGQIRPAHDVASATPQGVMGLSGNTWELTDSEHTDGHTRFVMLRGGAYLPPGESEWLVARGARPNDSHAKYVLLSDGLDRSESVSFRTVADVDG